LLTKVQPNSLASGFVIDWEKVFVDNKMTELCSKASAATHFSTMAQGCDLVY
jgi:hypothetical protein